MERLNDAMSKIAIGILVAALVVMIANTTDAATRATGFLKGIEGFRPVPYLDAVGKKSIGYGFTSLDMVGRGRLSEREASMELFRLCRSISRKLRAELNNQRLAAFEETALVSFVYNVGWANFKASTMCRLLKEGKRGAEVSKEFARWIYITKNGRKVISKGLQERRKRERLCFEGRKAF